MTRTAIMVCVLAGAAGAAQAASVEFQIVERRGQTSWNPNTAQVAPGNDNILNLAIQARVVGGAAGEGMGNWGLNMIMPGEGETATGHLNKAVIWSGSDYDTSSAQYNNNASVGQGGLAGSYAYLAAVNPNFNGLINSSAGSWTQTSNQDIGLVTGSPTGGALLSVFGRAGNTDDGGFSVPDSWVSGTTASLDPALSQQYLGANGNWVDIYHFNYTITSSAARVLHFTLDSAVAQTFTSLASSDNTWGPADPVDATTTSTGLDIAIVPAPGAMALLGLGGLVAARRRRA